MAELIGKSIQELNQTPVLQNSSSFAVQREGSTRVEKVKLESIVDFLNKDDKTKLANQTLAKESVKDGIIDHSTDNDPHGDRAYTNSIITTHLSHTDPHGDRLYTLNQIDVHSKAVDPHGDRAFTTQAIKDHASYNDPHGDRAYTNKQINDHSLALDPHADRAYALNLMLEHTNDFVDPHGLKSYTDNQLKVHKEEEDPHGLYSRMIEIIQAHESNNDAHNMGEKLNNLDNLITSGINNSLTAKLGTVLPYLVEGIIPSKFIKKSIVVSNQLDLPTIGEEGVLYVNTSLRSLSVWVDSRYVVISGGAEGFVGLTTDNVDVGANEDRKYYTIKDRVEVAKKIDTIKTDPSGSSLFSESLTADSELYLKSILSEGSVQIVDEGTRLILKTDDYVFKANYNEDVILTSDTDILDNIDYNDLVVIQGTVTATNYKAAGDMRLVNYLNSWNVSAVLATQGTSTAVTKPSGLVISSNGLVITGVTAPTTSVEIYSPDNELLGTAVSLTEGSFTVVLNSAELTGRKLKVYTVTPEGNRSEPTYFFTNNTTSIKEITNISYSKDGQIIRGITSRGAVVKITDSTQVELGSATADNFGNFSVTLNKALITNDTIRLTAKLGATLTTTVEEHIVTLKDIESPYNITYNDERTVFKGSAEPNSIVSFRYNNRDFSTTTGTNGKWIIFSFSNPVSTSNELIFTVKQEERKATTALTLEEGFSKNSSEPLVKEVVTNFETKFLIKNITPVLGEAKDAGLELIFNPVTRNIELHGKNKDAKEVIWLAQLNIIKDSLAIKTVEEEENV